MFAFQRDGAQVLEKHIPDSQKLARFAFSFQKDLHIFQGEEEGTHKVL